MSRRRRRREAPLPASSAGLLRFFEDETQGVKIGPRAVIMGSVALIVVAILLNLLFA